MNGRAAPLTRRQGLALAGLLAGGAGAAWLLRRSAPIGRDVAGNAAARGVLADRTAPVLGPKDADLTMAVFIDYRCAACRAAYPGMMAAIRDDGRVRLLVLDWPIFGEPSRRAARVALAAGRQGLYGPVHNRLMTDPRAPEETMLADVVAAAGGDPARLRADLTEHAEAIDRRLARTAEQAFALGLPGTPAYLIGPTLVVGALTEADFARAFSQARERRGYR